MGEMWNLWHGCHKKSEGCKHCYVYRRDAEFDKDSSIVTKTSTFNLPIRRNRQGEWKVPSGTLIWTCFTSDFFIEEADEWREDAWLMIQRRSDLHFFMITKRPESIICEPLLESIDFRDGLGSWCEQVTVGGESGRDARVCDYAWVLGIREQCIAANVPFHFKQTGAHFRMEGRLYNIPRKWQMQQAHRAGIDYKT